MATDTDVRGKVSETLHEIFDSNDLSTIHNALRVARDEYQKHAGEFQQVADYIAAGHEYPLFATGPGGVKAAENLRDQFKRQAEEVEKLMEEFE